MLTTTTVAAEPETKSWKDSKIVKLSIALVVASLGYLGVTFGFFTPTDFESAQTVYPEIETGVNLIRAGQVVSGVTAIGGALIIYFRIFNTTKLLPQSLRKLLTAS